MVGLPLRLQQGHTEIVDILKSPTKVASSAISKVADNLIVGSASSRAYTPAASGAAATATVRPSGGAGTGSSSVVKDKITCKK